MLASEEYIVVQQISRHLEYSLVPELGLNLLKPDVAVSFYECSEPRHRRLNLTEQSSYRALIFDVEILLPIAFEDSLDVCPRE